MRKLILAILPLLLTGCAAIGTQTVYRTAEVPHIRTIAYCGLGNIEFLKSVFPDADGVFRSAIDRSVEKYGMPLPVAVRSGVPEIKEFISKVCEDNNVDALLFTDLQFIYVTYSVYFVPVMSNYDTDVAMRLYDRQGNLLYSTRHNTLRGNSYMMPPTADKTVRDGVQGAFRRIAKEMKLKSVK